MQTAVKTLSLAFTFLFITFAAVQYNDPDYLVWIFAYLVPAYISFSAFKGRYNKELIAVVLIGSLLGAITFFPYGHFEGVALDHGMKTMNIELARESLGLGIVALVAVIYMALAFKR